MGELTKTPVSLNLKTKIISAGLSASEGRDHEHPQKVPERARNRAKHRPSHGIY